MTTTTVLSDDTATIVRDDVSRFQWAPVLAGAVIATAVTFFLVSAGSALGLSLVSAHDATATGVRSFITLGAVFFVAAQAFGFAVGGHITGRLLGLSPDDSEDENFRTDAHGLAVWALGVVFGLTLLAITAGLGGAAAGKAAATPASYWADKLFAGAMTQQSALGYRQYAQNDAATPVDSDASQPIDHAMSAPMAAQATAPATLRDAKDEAARLLTADMAKDANARSNDKAQLTDLVADHTGLSPSAARARVNDVENDMRASIREAADTARKAATYLALWTALALLFSAVVCVVATLSARWEDDRDMFGRPRVRSATL